MKDKPTVLFETEGSYPFSGGGVSTWSHILCSELEDRVDFILMALTGDPYVESRYELSPNVKSVIHIPLWGGEEPVRHFYGELPFSEHIIRKANTTSGKVKRVFLPVFRDFMERLMNPYRPAGEFGEVIYGMWKFYQHFDYKQTLSNPHIWIEFKRQLARKYSDSGEFKVSETPSMFDVTFGMRWLYHFMMPLAAPIPEVSLTHSTLAGFPSLTSIAAKYEYGTPALLTDHGVFIRERLINVSQTDYPYFSKQLLLDLATFVTRAIYTQADQISPVTSVNTKWEMKFEAKEEKIDTIYNGVDTDVFKPTPKPSHSADTPTVVAAAQVFPLKDIETMIRACDIVRREIPEVQFIVYGSLDVDKDYAQKCQKLVDELDLNDHFRFGGFHNEPSMIYNEGDISILSSISEGFPYTVIESMSCARPVVATDVGGIREALEGCGVLCKPRDPGELAEGVIKLLKDDNLRVELGRKARERVLLNYTIEKSVDNYYEVYRDFSERKRNPLKEQLTLPSVENLVRELEADE